MRKCAKYIGKDDVLHNDDGIYHQIGDLLNGCLSIIIHLFDLQNPVFNICMNFEDLGQVLGAIGTRDQDFITYLWFYIAFLNPLSDLRCRKLLCERPRARVLILFHLDLY